MIEFLIRKEYLKEYIRGAQNKKKRQDHSRSSDSRAIGKRPISGAINTIMRAIKKWAISKNKRMAHLRSVMTIGAPFKKHKSDEN